MPRTIRVGRTHHTASKSDGGDHMKVSSELLLLAHALHVLLVIVGEAFGDTVVHIRDIVDGV